MDEEAEDESADVFHANNYGEHCMHTQIHIWKKNAVSCTYVKVYIQYSSMYGIIPVYRLLLDEVI